MRRGLALSLILFALVAAAGAAEAGVPTVHANNIFNREPGEEFNVDVIVECHAEANYTVSITLHQRFEFSDDEGDMEVSGENASITYLGYDTDRLTFRFPMMAKNDTPDGDYRMTYQLHWNGSETGYEYTFVESDKVRVSINEGGEAPCATTNMLVLPFMAFGLTIYINKRKNR